MFDAAASTMVCSTPCLAQHVTVYVALLQPTLPAGSICGEGSTCADDGVCVPGPIPDPPVPDPPVPDPPVPDPPVPDPPVPDPPVPVPGCDEVTNPCGLEPELGENCGTSVCNKVTGLCEKDSVEVGEQCSGCDVCEDNQCASAPHS